MEVRDTQKESGSPLEIQGLAAWSRVFDTKVTESWSFESFVAHYL